MVGCDNCASVGVCRNKELLQHIRKGARKAELFIREVSDDPTERTLFGEPGGYVPLLDKRTKGTPCPRCRTPIERFQYLGGSCYVCPRCQPSAASNGRTARAA